MSRAHMIYDDRPLQQEGVRTIKWDGKWDPKTLCQGSGILLEGVFHKITKHAIQDSSGTKYRYVVFHVEFQTGCLRRYDSQGKEVEVNLGQTALVRTGFLHSSYKQETKLTADIIDYQKATQRTRSPLHDMVPPSHAGELCLWGEESMYDHVEVHYGQIVRIKTKGNSPFVDSFTRLDSVQKHTSSNYTGGEKTGQSWTSKVMGVKQTQDTPPSLPQDEVEGVADDEWDD